MPSKTRNVHVDPSPHLDGANQFDVTRTRSDSLSVFTHLNPSEEIGMEKSPYKFIPKADPMMERFEKLMRGTKKE